jgi:hypothetical protein
MSTKKSQFELQKNLDNTEPIINQGSKSPSQKTSWLEKAPIQSASTQAETQNKPMQQLMKIASSEIIFDTSNLKDVQNPPVEKINKWDKADQEAVNILKKWNEAKTKSSTIKGKEVYSYLPEDIRKPYEDYLRKYEAFERKYGIGSYQANKLDSTVEEFNYENEKIKNIVENEQKVYDLTGMTSYHFKGKHNRNDLTDLQIQEIQRRVKNAGAEFGWENVMKKAAEVIQQTDSDNSFWILDTIYTSGDKSLASNFASIVINNQIRSNVRWCAVEAIRQWEDKSVAPRLVEALADRQTPLRLARKITDTLEKLNDRSVTKRLSEIHNSLEIDQDTRDKIAYLLQNWK